MSITKTHNETEKQLVPAIRFDGYETNWPKVDLKSVVKVNQGLAILRSNRFEKEGPNRYNYITIPYLLGGESHFIEKPQESVKCKEDDVIVTRTGSGVGQIWTGISGVFHNNFFKVLPVEDKVRKDFIYHYLLTPFVQRKMKSFAGSSAIPDLNHSEFYLLPFNLPTLPEQQKIASFLSAVDEKIQQLTAKKNLLEQYKKGVMQKLFSGKIRFKDENGKDFPDWEEKRLGEIFSCVRGKGISKDQLIDNGENKCILYGQLYTTYNEIVFDVISKTDAKEGVLSMDADLLIPSSTTTSGIDLANVTALNEEGVLLGGDISILRSKIQTNNVFYAYYLSNHKKYEIAAFAQGSTIVHLSYNHFKVMLIDVLCIEEQQKIATYLSSLDTKIETVNKRITQTQTFKKGLLQQMFV